MPNFFKMTIFSKPDLEICIGNLISHIKSDALREVRPDHPIMLMGET